MAYSNDNDEDDSGYIDVHGDIKVGKLMPHNQPIGTVNRGGPKTPRPANQSGANNELALRPVSADKTYQLWRIGSLGLVFAAAIAGTIFWVIGILNILPAPTSLTISKTPTEAEASELVENYNNGRKYYVTGPLDLSVEAFQKVVEKDPAFNGDATAFLFLAYRSQAEQQLASNQEREQAPQTYSKAVALIEKYRAVLLEQLKPNILLNKFPNGAALLEDTAKQKSWVDGYFKGRNFSAKKDGPEWWNGAITAWEPVYKENKELVAEPKEEALATLLAEAYFQKAIYSCVTKHDFAVAKTALEKQVEIIKASNLGDKEQKLKETAERLEDYKLSQCRSS